MCQCFYLKVSPFRQCVKIKYRLVFSKKPWAFRYVAFRNLLIANLSYGQSRVVLHAIVFSNESTVFICLREVFNTVSLILRLHCNGINSAIVYNVYQWADCIGFAATYMYLCYVLCTLLSHPPSTPTVPEAGGTEWGQSIESMADQLSQFTPRCNAASHCGPRQGYTCRPHP